jgi:hypothetical protein
VNVLSPTIFAVMTRYLSNMRPSAYATGVFVVNMVLVQLAFVAWALFAASIEVRRRACAVTGAR